MKNQIDVSMSLKEQLHSQFNFLVPEVAAEFGIQNVNKNELIAAGNLGLSKAIARCLGSLSRESAAQAIRNEIKDHLGAEASVAESTVSLEQPIYQSEDSHTVLTIGDTIADRAPNPEELAMITEAFERVEHIMQRFSGLNRQILERRWLWPYYDFDAQPTFKAIATELKMTEKQVQRKYNNLMETIDAIKNCGIAANKNKEKL